MNEENQHGTIRIWHKVETKEIAKHLILIDDLYGGCANCKQLGLNYLKDRVCPKCKTEFKYIATKLKDPSVITKLLSRIESESLPLTLIDRDDWDRARAKDALSDLF